MCSSEFRRYVNAPLEEALFFSFFEFYVWCARKKEDARVVPIFAAMWMRHSHTFLWTQILCGQNCADKGFYAECRSRSNSYIYLDFPAQNLFSAIT